MVDFTKLQETYFIGEIGINHNGDIRLAKKLIQQCDQRNTMGHNDIS